jgi:hypothetical protein
MLVHRRERARRAGAASIGLRPTRRRGVSPALLGEQT